MDCIFSVWYPSFPHPTARTCLYTYIVRGSVCRWPNRVRSNTNFARVVGVSARGTEVPAHGTGGLKPTGFANDSRRYDIRQGRSGQKMAMDDVTSADTQTQVDSARLETLLDKMARDVSGMMSTVMAHVGDRLGLFTTLAVGPATSAELAARADVSERYVREWLGGMAAAGYITYDAVSDTYSLSPEQTRVLAEEGGPFFMGGVYQTTPALMGPLELLLDAFRKGGGVPQSAYPSDLWEGMERSSAVWSNHLLARTIQAEMPHVQTMLDAGARVADIGCGHGSALIALARAFPAAHYVGYDQFAPEVARATENAKVAG